MDMNTPETDSNIWSDSCEGILCKVVSAEFARRLERERDEAREALEFRRELYKVQEKCLETARRERDEAREEAHRFRSLSYARSGIDKSASWFPWETSLNLAQKAQLLATEKHAK